MLFDSEYPSCIHDCLYDRFTVDWLDGMHVDDADAKAVIFRKCLGSVQSLKHCDAAADDGKVSALSHGDGLADFVFIVIALIAWRLESSADTYIDRSRDVDAGLDGFAGLDTVCRADHCHIRDGAHDGKVLGAVVCCPCVPEGDACMGGDDLDRQILISYISPDLLAGTHRREDRHGGNERDQAALGKSRSDAHHVLLGDADIVETVRVLVCEEFDRGSFLEVGRHSDDLVVGFSQVCKSTSVDLSRCHGRAVIGVPVGSGNNCHSTRLPS